MFWSVRFIETLKVDVDRTRSDTAAAPGAERWRRSLVGRSSVAQQQQQSEERTDVWSRDEPMNRSYSKDQEKFQDDLYAKEVRAQWDLYRYLSPLSPLVTIP